jgi:transcriptional regulator with XRE-family HTH domain
MPERRRIPPGVFDEVVRKQLATEIGARIADARERADLTSEELANEIGASRGSVSLWENGHNLPDVLLLARTAQRLKISFDGLILGSDAAEEMWYEYFFSDAKAVGVAPKIMQSSNIVEEENDSLTQRQRSIRNFVDGLKTGDELSGAATPPGSSGEEEPLWAQGLRKEIARAHQRLDKLGGRLEPVLGARAEANTGTPPNEAMPREKGKPAARASRDRKAQ